MLNLEAKNTHYVFDAKGYPVVKGDLKSINDCCGRLVLMGICYGFTPEIIEKLEALLIKHKGRERIIRHPDNPVISSRDHHSYFCIYRVFTGQPVPDFPKMRGMNQWMRILRGKKNSYYFWQIPGAYLSNWWLRSCRQAGRIRSERDNNEWITEVDTNIINDFSRYTGTIGGWILKCRTPWQKFWANVIFITIPAYPLHNKGWQLYVMPESKKKEKLKRILLKRINTGCPCQSYGNSNIMLRLLFGDTTVTQVEINNYPHMTGYRPGVYLDETCRRTIRELTEVEAEFNAYEKQLIIWLFNKTKNPLTKMKGKWPGNETFEELMENL